MLQPSKNLIEAARLVYDARNPRHPGIAPHAPPIDFDQLVTQKDEIISGYRDKKYQSIIGTEQDIDNEEIELKELLPSLIIVGGGYIALSQHSIRPPLIRSKVTRRRSLR